MFGRNTGKPLKGPTMGAHTIHVQYYVSLQQQMSVLLVIFLSKVQLRVSRTAINNQFSSR